MNGKNQFITESGCEGSLSGQFRLADLDNRLKCVFYDAMHTATTTTNAATVIGPEKRCQSAPQSSNQSASGPAAMSRAGADPFGLLRYAHNEDSPLGTGLLRRKPRTAELKRPPHGGSASLLAMVRGARVAQ